MIVDGAFFSIDLAKKAIQEGIKLIPGQLGGRKPYKTKMSYASFEIDEEKNIITNCANNQIPVKSEFNYDKQTYTAKFTKESCENCEHCAKCRIQVQKKFNTVRFSETCYLAEKMRLKMETKEYMTLTNQRAGVEGLPSIFRRRYNVDNMPLKGLVRSKIWFGFKVGAINIKKLIRGLKLVTE